VKGFGVAGRWRNGWLCYGGGEKWEGGREGVLFIRVGFLVCATRSPLQFYLQFEAFLFFSSHFRKISRVGDKLFASIRTPYKFGDRALGGSCETEYGSVKGCGAGRVRHGAGTELSTAEGDRPCVGRRAGGAHTEGSWAWWAARGKMKKGKGGPGARELAQPVEF
jgi:hypothetical protein